jgi:hypothetical protein
MTAGRTPRTRGCLLVAAVLLVLATTVAAVLLPGLVRRGREMFAPIRKMQSAQQDFEAWSKQQAWREPTVPTVNAAQLDRFLALRKELRHLEEEAPRPDREPGDPQPRFEDVPKIVGGVSGYFSARFDAFKRAGMTNAEYRYLERLVYTRWLSALRVAGQDPAVLDRVVQEILSTAREEPNAATAARLHAAAERVRQRRPGPPSGVPEEVHALLLDQATEIEALSDSPAPRFGPEDE